MRQELLDQLATLPPKFDFRFGSLAEKKRFEVVFGEALGYEATGDATDSLAVKDLVTVCNAQVCMASAPKTQTRLHQFVTATQRLDEIGKREITRLRTAQTKFQNAEQKLTQQIADLQDELAKLRDSHQEDADDLETVRRLESTIDAVENFGNPTTQAGLAIVKQRLKQPAAAQSADQFQRTQFFKV